MTRKLYNFSARSFARMRKLFDDDKPFVDDKGKEWRKSQLKGQTVKLVTKIDDHYGRLTMTVT